MSVLRTVPMVHFRAQVAMRDAPAVTRVIAGAGLLHLVDIAHGRNPSDSAPPGTAELYAAYRDLSNRTRSLADKLGIDLTEPAGSLADKATNDFAAERDSLAAIVEPIETRVGKLTHALASARERAEQLREKVADAERLREASIDVRRVCAARFVTLRFALAGEQAVDTLASMLTPSPFVIERLETRDPALIAIAVPNFSRPRLDEALRVSLIKPVRIPENDADRAIAERDQALRDEQTAEAGIARERAEITPTLRSAAQKAEIGTLLLQAQTYFAAAGRFVVMSGWLPEAGAARLTEKIRAVAGENAIIDIERAENVPGVLEGSLRVPILHRNPIVLRPFQRLIDLYGTPSYGEVQPTAFFAISFLLMFGLMFGDVGHGAVLFLAGWCLFRFMPQYLDYGILLMEAGAASTAFGVLYGSVFGVHTLLPTLWLEPMADLPRFMMAAVVIGALIITTGLLLNVVNAWRSGEIRQALYGPRGLSAALLYWIALVLLARMFVPATFAVPGFVIVVLGIAAAVVLIGGRAFAHRFEHRRPQPAVTARPSSLVLLESAVELVDTIFSYFANTVSFVRIAAFAAVHAGVFIAIFAVADTLAQMRAGGVLSIVVHVAGNAVMILLEGLTVSVQVLRLEYYEFFGKFFRGGGEPYLPLMLRHEARAMGDLGRKHA